MLFRSEAEKADAVLVSKVVTQHNIHMRDMKDLMHRARQLGLLEKMVFVAGGPRVTHPLALECGFDAGFGVGTKPSDVASYIVEEFLRRQEGAVAPMGEPAVRAVKPRTKKKAASRAKTAKSRIAKRPKARASSKR